MAVPALWLLRHNFPEVPKAESPRLRNTDCMGLLLAAIGFLALQLLLSRGHIDDWFGSMHIRTLAVVSAIAIVAFAVWESSPRNRFPLIDVSLFKSHHMMAAIFIGAFAGMILSGSLFVLPEYLRLVDSQTHSASQTGRLIAFYALTGAALGPGWPKLSPLWGHENLSRRDFAC